MHIIFISTATLLLVAGGTFFMLKKSFQRNEEKQPQNEKRSISGSFFVWFQNIFQQSEQITVVEAMSYDEALKYFIQERPKDNQKIKKGAIFRKKQQDGYFLMWAFLDKDEEFVLDDEGNPYGRQMIVHKLDKELTETFGDGDLIIVE